MKGAVAATIQALGLLLVTAGTVSAQDSFTDLQKKVKPGDRVSITDDAGNRIRGTVEGVSASIRISVDGVEQEWLPAQIREIRRRGDSVSNGLKIGIASGGAAGVVFGLAVASLLQNEGHDAAGAFVAMVGLGVGAGAAIGAGLDAAITATQWSTGAPRGRFQLRRRSLLGLEVYASAWPSNQILVLIAAHDDINRSSPGVAFWVPVVPCGE